jgi:hypothetical protein
MLGQPKRFRKFGKVLQIATTKATNLMSNAMTESHAALGNLTCMSAEFAENDIIGC